MSNITKKQRKKQRKNITKIQRKKQRKNITKIQRKKQRKNQNKLKSKKGKGFSLFRKRTKQNSKEIPIRRYMKPEEIEALRKQEEEIKHLLRISFNHKPRKENIVIIKNPNYEKNI